MLFASPFGGTVGITASGLEITFGTINFNKHPEAYRDLLGLIGDTADFGFDSTLTLIAMLAATAILSAKGTKREMVPAPAKLNAVRAKTNKPPIPQHVVIKIGEVFDKDGKSACLRAWIAAFAPSPRTYSAASAWPAAQRTQTDLHQSDVG
jgi:hypothetical protein